MMRRSDPIDRTGRENDLLTDAQLAVRWQLSRGTFGESAISGPWSGLSQVGRSGPIPTLGYRSLRTGRFRVARASWNYILW